MERVDDLAGLARMRRLLATHVEARGFLIRGDQDL